MLLAAHIYSIMSSLSSAFIVHYPCSQLRSQVLHCTQLQHPPFFTNPGACVKDDPLIMFHPVCSLVTGTLTNTKNLPCDALKIRQPFSNVFEETSYEVSPSANLLALHVRRAACRGLPFETFGGATASAFPHSPVFFSPSSPCVFLFPLCGYFLLCLPFPSGS